MWYMLLEPKLGVYSNLLPRSSASGFVTVRKASASRWAIGSLVVSIWENFSFRRLRRRTIKEFASLDDRLLHDIGLERGRIPETVDAMLRRQPDPAFPVSWIGPESENTGDSFPVRVFKTLAKAWVRRRAINQLARLDNRLLRDIGLDRDQIPAAVDAMLDRKPATGGSATVHYLFESEEAVREEHPTRAAA